MSEESNSSNIVKYAVAGAVGIGVGVAGAAFTSADGHEGLAEYPGVLLDDEQNLDATIAVGSAGAQADVVGAVDIAGSLGQAAFAEEELEVSVPGGAAEWSAENGVTLDTARQDLFFGQEIAEVRSTLTDRHLSTLEEVEFEDDDGSTYDIRYRLDVGQEDDEGPNVEFGNDVEDLDDEDPELHVPLSEDAEDEGFATIEANINPAINFADEDVRDETLSLFGNTYTVADDQLDEEDYLTLFGSDERFTVDTGESTTFTDTDGNEHTVEVLVVDEGDAQIVLNDDRRTMEEGDSRNLPGTDDRVRIIDTFDDDADLGVTGAVVFAVGSEEINIPLAEDTDNGGEIEDGDGDDIDGSYAAAVTDDDDQSFADNGDLVDELEVRTIQLRVGTHDDDVTEAVLTGETYSHPAFGEIELHFGGLLPDTTTAETEGVTAINVDNDGDDQAEVTFTHEFGDEETFNFATVPSDDVIELSNDGDTIHQATRVFMEEDEYFTADAGDFSRLFEITDVDAEDEEDEDIEVEFEDVYTGETFTLEGFNSDDTELDGKAADSFNPDGPSIHVEVTDDDEVAIEYEGDHQDTRTAYAPLHTDVDSSITLQGQQLLHSENTEGGTVTLDEEFEMPNSVDEEKDVLDIDVEVTHDETDDEINITYDGDFSGDHTGVDEVGEYVSEVETVGELGYALVVETSGGEDDIDVDVSLAPSDTDREYMDVRFASLELEHDDTTGSDQEAAYVVEVEAEDDEVDINQPDYTQDDYSGFQNLESDDDLYQAYNVYGTFAEYDSDDEGEVTINVPEAQAAAGAAFTAQGGTLTGEGTPGVDVDETIRTPTGWPTPVGALDTDPQVDEAGVGQDMVVVGGPAVNEVTERIAEDHEEVPTQEDWLEDREPGDWEIRMVEDAIEEGHAAVVVAGYDAEDTTAAAEALADWEDTGFPAETVFTNEDLTT